VAVGRDNRIGLGCAVRRRGLAALVAVRAPRQELRKGDEAGVGAVRRYTWSSRLPYSLTFDMRVTRVQRPQLIEGEAIGELTGTGRWTLSTQADAVRVRYDWQVETTRPWMNALAPLLSPAFRWNHGEVMRAGAAGLARHLGARLLAC
jgi:hypothetical protein